MQCGVTLPVGDFRGYTDIKKCVFSAKRGSLGYATGAMSSTDCSPNSCPVATELSYLRESVVIEGEQYLIQSESKNVSV